MRENEGTCVTGSPPEQSARGRGQRRTEGGFYHTNSHFDHLSLHTARSLCIPWIPAHFVPPLQGPLSPKRIPLQSSYSRVPIGVAEIGTGAGDAITGPSFR